MPAHLPKWFREFATFTSTLRINIFLTFIILPFIYAHVSLLGRLTHWLPLRQRIGINLDPRTSIDIFTTIQSIQLTERTNRILSQHKTMNVYYGLIEKVLQKCAVTANCAKICCLSLEACKKCEKSFPSVAVEPFHAGSTATMWLCTEQFFLPYFVFPFFSVFVSVRSDGFGLTSLHPAISISLALCSTLRACVVCVCVCVSNLHGRV